MVIPSLWVNGQEQESLPLPDRGLEFGDGLFETLLCRSGDILFIERHLARLSRGFKILGFSVAADSLRSHLKQACDQYKECDWSVVRITVTRGGSERGYAPADNPQPNIIVRASRIDRDCSEFTCVEIMMVEGIQLSPQKVFAGIKHLNRLEQVLAARELRQSGFDEGLMRNVDNAFVSVVAGNIFIARGGVIITPPAQDCVVIGTRRALILEEWAPRIGVTVEERPLSFSDIESADELFYSNAIYGVRGVSSMAGRRWSEWPVARQIFNAYREDIA